MYNLPIKDTVLFFERDSVSRTIESSGIEIFARKLFSTFIGRAPDRTNCSRDVPNLVAEPKTKMSPIGSWYLRKMARNSTNVMCEVNRSEFVRWSMERSVWGESEPREMSVTYSSSLHDKRHALRQSPPPTTAMHRKSRANFLCVAFRFFSVL